MEREGRVVKWEVERGSPGGRGSLDSSAVWVHVTLNMLAAHPPTHSSRPTAARPQQPAPPPTIFIVSVRSSHPSASQRVNTMSFSARWASSGAMRLQAEGGGVGEEGNTERVNAMSFSARRASSGAMRLQEGGWGGVNRNMCQMSMA